MTVTEPPRPATTPSPTASADEPAPAVTSRPPPVPPPPEPLPDDKPRPDVAPTSVDAVSSKCADAAARVKNRPCQKDADCKLSAACDHDDLRGKCVMRGPPVAGKPGVTSFCAAQRGDCDVPYTFDSVGRKHYKPYCLP